MVLIVSVELTINVISRSAVPDTVRAATLDHEVRYHAMESQAIIKTFSGKCDEVIDGIGRVLVEELDLHDALFGMDLCCFHYVLYQVQATFFISDF